MALDTVTNASATPDFVLPFEQLGLKADEFEKIKTILGRRPTGSELAMYSVMWSEHCSYKSSKIHLKQFGLITWLTAWLTTWLTAWLTAWFITW